MRLGAALHDLLALGHPELGGRAIAARRSRRRGGAGARVDRAAGRPRARPSTGIRCWRACPRSCASIAPCTSGWGARRSWGARPPPRVTALPGLRRVRIEATSRSWLREIGIPVVGRQAFLALNVASPLGEALDPLRLDPPIAWGRILPVLRVSRRWRASSPGRRWRSASTDRATRWRTRSTGSRRFTIRSREPTPRPKRWRSRCGSWRTSSGWTSCSGRQPRSRNRLTSPTSIARSSRASIWPSC